MQRKERNEMQHVVDPADLDLPATQPIDITSMVEDDAGEAGDASR